ncbi:chemotaxis protein CheW [Pseudoxanthomonas sp.]|uniref:chemotaxis protein CheW n=1 Tax=Pseudoxanthomonas sp. TaxID=1871049 RepID=UPI00260F41CC|nr:chemotaxis protein CheW [Pseudoxanthomonas sp.]WDS36816.1 MAG: chemotaxis protein CheW [Pseudoxanthomonas sp.]
MSIPSPGVIDDYLEGLLHEIVAAEQIAPSPAPERKGPTPEELAAAVLAEADADPALACILSTQAAAPERQGPTPEELAAAVLAEADADPALAGILSTQAAAPERKGPTPEELAAAVLAEADADPALAGILSTQASAPERKGPTPEELAAAVLAEADADPALAGILSIQAPAPERKGPTPEELAAAVLAEADADPALAGILSTAAENLAEADADAAMQAEQAGSMVHPPEHRAQAERTRDAFAPQVPLVDLQSFMPQGSSVDAAAPPRNRRAPDRSTRWLRLRCGEQAYALELLKVQEVVLPVPLLPLRGTAASMLGIMNLRGQVVPVIDLGLHLGAAPVEMDMLTRIVVLEENGEALGLRVSAVEDVATLTDQQIELPDTARIGRISNDLFRGVARVAGPPMILLDAEQLLH